MKRLILPLILVITSLVVAAVLTTITAVTFASYSTDKTQDKTLMIEQPMAKAIAKLR